MFIPNSSLFGPLILNVMNVNTMTPVGIKLTTVDSLQGGAKEKEKKQRKKKGKKTPIAVLKLQSFILNGSEWNTVSSICK